MTNNPAHFGTYYIQLDVTVDGSNSIGTESIIYTFELNRCMLDQIQIRDQITDITYFLGQDPLVIDAGITNQFPECPVTLTLTQDNGQPFNTEIFTLD